jgi:hypothetical protein
MCPQATIRGYDWSPLVENGEPALQALEKVSRTKVSAKLLGEAMEIHADMPAEDRSVFEAHALRLFEFLKEKGYKGRRHADLAVAINFRLIALGRLVQGNHMKGWTLPGHTEGSTYLHADLLKVAAEEPLIEDSDGSVSFDVQNFALRLLEVAKTKGRA